MRSPFVVPTVNAWTTLAVDLTHNSFGKRGSITMKYLVDTADEDKDEFPEQELTEEQFLEQFAALEESIALLQIHVRSMSENAEVFGRLARNIRRSVCPATLSPR
jgi:hypothetical protein